MPCVSSIKIIVPRKEQHFIWKGWRHPRVWRLGEDYRPFKRHMAANLEVSRAGGSRESSSTLCENMIRTESRRLGAGEPADQWSPNSSSGRTLARVNGLIESVKPVHFPNTKVRKIIRMKRFFLILHEFCEFWALVKFTCLHISI